MKRRFEKRRNAWVGFIVKPKRKIYCGLMNEKKRLHIGDTVSLQMDIHRLFYVTQLSP